MSGVSRVKGLIPMSAKHFFSQICYQNMFNFLKWRWDTFLSHINEAKYDQRLIILRRSLNCLENASTADY